MSNMRYKFVKSGNSINNIINLQAPKIEKFLDIVRNDEFYNCPELNEERKKLNNMHIEKQDQSIEVDEKPEVSAREEYSSLLQKESGLFKTQIDSYLRDLSTYKTKVEKFEKEKDKGLKFNLKQDDIKLLNFNSNPVKPAKQKTVLKKNEIDMQLLI